MTFWHLASIADGNYFDRLFEQEILVHALIAYASSKGSDETAQMRCLVRTFVDRKHKEETLMKAQVTMDLPIIQTKGSEMVQQLIFAISKGLFTGRRVLMLSFYLLLYIFYF